MTNKKTETSSTNNAPKVNMGPGPRGRGIAEKPKDFKGTLKKLVNYLKPYQFTIMIAMIFAIGSTIISIVGPKVLGKATTALATGLVAKATGSGGIDFDYILRIILLLIVLYVFSALFGYIQNITMTKVAQKTAYNLRKEFSDKVDRLPLSYFDNVSQGDVLSRITNDIDTISQSLNQSISQIISSVMTLIGVTVMMLSISWQMTVFAFCVLPFSGIIIMMITKRSQKYFINQQKYLGQLNGHVEEMYGGHTVIKAFNGEEESIETFIGYNDNLYKTAWKAQFLSGLMQPITLFIGNIGYVGVCLLGGYFAIKQTISIGDIQAFIQYVRSFNQPISQVAQIMNVVQSTIAAGERVFEFLEEEEMLPETTTPVEIYEPNGQMAIHGAVTFDHVKFGYYTDNIVIKDFSMHIHAGQKVAIVGPTGAGKTTIVKLLMRFYELNSGSIFVDGHNITDYVRKDLRSLFGMVLQDAWLFNGTIKENLRFGNLSATDEEIVRAAKEARVNYFVSTLEHGYDTEINESSSNVSQGQKQLLTIARAFLADPKILILDEATSSVDTRTEVLIQEGMNKLMEGRTSFIIAHRLSTIRDADMIMVIKEGDIVEVGNHEELLASNGFYASLYQSQFENCE